MPFGVVGTRSSGPPEPPKEDLAPTRFLGFSIRRATRPYLCEASLEKFIPLGQCAVSGKNPENVSLWCTAGVVVGRNGKNLRLWDLVFASPKYITLCLSGAAEAQHWSTDTGAVVLIRDATVLHPHVLCIRGVEGLRVVGSSPDLGLCSGSRRDGGACGNPIHAGKSMFCHEHLTSSLHQLSKENRDLGPIVVPRQMKKMVNIQAFDKQCVEVLSYAPKRGREEVKPVNGSSSFINTFGTESVIAIDDKKVELLQRRAAYDAIEDRLDRYANQEKAQEQLASVKEVEAVGYLCHDCQRWYFKAENACTKAGHSMTRETTVKRFFRCTNEPCQCLITLLGARHPPDMCPRCAGKSWRQVGAFSEKVYSTNNPKGFAL